MYPYPMRTGKNMLCEKPAGLTGGLGIIHCVSSDFNDNPESLGHGGIPAAGERIHPGRAMAP